MAQRPVIECIHKTVRIPWIVTSGALCPILNLLKQLECTEVGQLKEHFPNDLSLNEDNDKQRLDQFKIRKIITSLSHCFIETYRFLSSTNYRQNISCQLRQHLTDSLGELWV